MATQNINTVGISAALEDDDYLIVSIDGTLKRIMVRDLKILLESQGTGDIVFTITENGLLHVEHKGE